MDLPAELRAALDRVLENSQVGVLAPIAERQSDAYRTRTPDAYASALVAGAEDALAYAAWRMPATYAAVAAALEAVTARRPDFAPRSQLDLGSGPGTAIWAAWAGTGPIARVVGLERAQPFRDLAEWLTGSRLDDDTQDDAPRAEWHAVDLAQATPWPAIAPDDRFDLVTLCYVGGELTDAARTRAVERAWAHCEDVLLLVEPGTTAGYLRLMSIRAALVEAGAHIVAPCPHTEACPLTDGDWCHFAERVARSRMHRQLKGAELGYEDEKYAYLAMSRRPTATSAPGRVLRPPAVHKAAVEFVACTATGVEMLNVRRREKADYRLARKLRPGDAWPTSREAVD